MFTPLSHRSDDLNLKIISNTNLVCNKSWAIYLITLSLLFHFSFIAFHDRQGKEYQKEEE
jgi:hypothetical protein